jgi:hypothetical protein
MLRHTIELTLLLSVQVGCSGSDARKTESAPAQVPVAASASVESASGAPMLVTVQGPSLPVAGTLSTITVTVARRMVMPFDLTITLPKGVRLVSGSLTEHVEDGARGTVIRQLTVEFDAVPAEDLVVEAVSRGDGFGARSADAYRFGRAAPKLAAPPRSQEIRVNGRSLGQPVDLNK